MFKEAINLDNNKITETIIVECLISKIKNKIIRLIHLWEEIITSKITITNKITTVIDSNRNIILTKAKDNSILEIHNKKSLKK